MFESNLLNNMATTPSNQNMLIGDIRQIIESGRRQAYASVNASMIVTYWNIGRRIVEEEQHGEARAEYGDFLIKDLASDLTKDYGGNFSYRNLCHYRKFYLCFNDLEIVYARVHNLTWTHFRHLLRIDEEQVRLCPYNLLLPAAQQKLAMNHP